MRKQIVLFSIQSTLDYTAVQEGFKNLFHTTVIRDQQGSGEVLNSITYEQYNLKKGK